MYGGAERARLPHRGVLRRVAPALRRVRAAELHGAAQSLQSTTKERDWRREKKCVRRHFRHQAARVRPRTYYFPSHARTYEYM